MYRAETTDGQVVTGDHAKVDGKHFIIPDNAELTTTLRGCKFIDVICGFREVLPSTLARSTGIKDKNGVEIYGSFPVDGKMSTGGDDITFLVSNLEDEGRWLGEVRFWNKRAVFMIFELPPYKWSDAEENRERFYIDDCKDIKVTKGGEK